MSYQNLFFVHLPSTHGNGTSGTIVDFVVLLSVLVNNIRRYIHSYHLRKVIPNIRFFYFPILMLPSSGVKGGS